MAEQEEEKPRQARDGAAGFGRDLLHLPLQGRGAIRTTRSCVKTGRRAHASPRLAIICTNLLAELGLLGSTSARLELCGRELTVRLTNGEAAGGVTMEEVRFAQLLEHPPLNRMFHSLELGTSPDSLDGETRSPEPQPPARRRLEPERGTGPRRRA